ncbi:MFS transporter [Streptosporangium sp. NPDC005286]|uniref:MFS transporter n=1 Tax=Streptosporangium sp. NPDC005286 TaxID=3154463 RepID=UPI00339E678F
MGRSSKAAPSQAALVACLSYAALIGSVVAGLGSPIVPEVAKDRGVSIESAQWTLTITLLIGVVGTPVLSRLADGHLRRWVLIGALAAVGAGGLVGAAVPTFPGLLAGRALQGFGYAMVPLTVSIARQYLVGVKLHRTLAVLSTSIAVGVGLGNPVMGLCVLFFDYRAAFLFAMVVSFVGAVWVWWCVPAGSRASTTIRVDVPGAILLGVGLGASLLAVARGQTWGWTSVQVVGLGVLGLVTLAAWVLVELRHRAPLVDLRLACARGVLGVNLAAVLLGVAVFGGAAVMVLLIQQPTTHGLGLGYSVFVNGLLMLPMSIATLLSPPVARALARWTGVRSVLPVGSLAVAAAFGTFAVAHRVIWHIVVSMALLGVGIGVAYSVMPALIVARTPDGRTASATGINQVLRLMGGSVGAAAVASVLAGHIPAGELNPDETGYVLGAALATGAAVLAAVVGYVLVTATPKDGHDEVPGSVADLERAESGAAPA